MALTAIKLWRMPALLALLLAVLAGVPATAASADHRPGTIAPAVLLDDQAAAGDPAERGDVDPTDWGDAAVPAAVRGFVALRPGPLARHGASGCPSPGCATYRARAPPSL